jgi:hypothetical protein
LLGELDLEVLQNWTEIDRSRIPACSRRSRTISGSAVAATRGRHSVGTRVVSCFSSVLSEPFVRCLGGWPTAALNAFSRVAMIRSTICSTVRLSHLSVGPFRVIRLAIVMHTTLIQQLLGLLE